MGNNAVKIADLDINLAVILSITGPYELEIRQMIFFTKKGHSNNIYIQLNQVMQLAEHNTWVTEMVHCYQLNFKQSNIYKQISKHIIYSIIGAGMRLYETSDRQMILLNLCVTS